jgi:hypothetical protein
LYLQGVSLDKTIADTIHALKRRLRLGHEVRVLLIRPDSAAARLAEARLGVKPDYNRRKRQTQASLDRLTDLARDMGGRLQVKLTGQELSFEAAVVRSGTSQAAIYLQYYAFGGTQDGLRLVITPADGQWYGFHLSQTEALWKEATPAPGMPTAFAAAK